MVTALEYLLLLLTFNLFANQERTELQHKLSTFTSDHHRRQLEEQLTRVEERICENARIEQTYEWFILINERAIANIQGGAEERQRNEGE